MIKLTIALVLTNLLLASPFLENSLDNPKWQANLEQLSYLEDDPKALTKLIDEDIGFKKEVGFSDSVNEAIKKCPPFKTEFLVELGKFVTFVHESSFVSLVTNVFGLRKKVYDLFHNEIINKKCLNKIQGSIKENISKLIIHLKEDVIEAGIYRIGQVLVKNLSEIKAKCSSIIDKAEETLFVLTVIPLWELLKFFKYLKDLFNL
jgi:hypothetical protein